MTDSITITINGKTWKGKPEEFANSFKEFLRERESSTVIFGAKSAENNLLAFLQSYGDN